MRIKVILLTAFILGLSITVFQIDSFGQSCNDLRQKNETYASGEGESLSWCNIVPSTPYTQCMCENERNYTSSQNDRQQIIKEFNEAVKQVQKMRDEARQMSSAGNHDAAISLLESEVMQLAQNIPTGGIDTYEKSQKREIDYTEKAIASIEAEKEQQEMAANEKTITLSGSGSYNNSEEDDSSNSYDYSGNQDSEYSGSQDSEYSSSNATESIYQKKQRESAEVRAEQQRTKQQQQRQYDAQMAKTQQQIQRIDQADAMNQINNMLDQRNATIRAESDARKEKYRRIEAQREEDYRLEQIRIKRIRAERAEERRISNAQSYFLDNLKDNDMPIVANKKEVFFIVIATLYGEEIIELSPFSLFANNENNLPYKVDVINDYKNKTSRTHTYLQGPFSTFEEQKNAVASFQNNAKNNYVSSRLIKFSYVSKYENSNSQSTDFWGNKNSTNSQSKETKTKTQDTDFWGEEKNTKKKPKPKKSIWD